MNLPRDNEQDYDDYYCQRTAGIASWPNVALAAPWTLPCQPDEGLVWRRGQQRKQLGLRLLPKLDEPMYDVLKYFDMMYEGKVNGYFCQGFNPIAAFPNKAKVGAVDWRD